MKGIAEGVGGARDYGSIETEQQPAQRRNDRALQKV